MTRHHETGENLEEPLASLKQIGNSGTNKQMPSTSIPGSLPARAAILIIVCLLVALTGLWSFVLTGEMIAIGIGVLALVIAGPARGTNAAPG